ncbi:MAG: nucleoside 2-deoxyribosyltransferase [Loktanella sp.]|nr:nucleoside 2-deoxyribosyltransferase [Loktanella sp.]
MNTNEDYPLLLVGEIVVDFTTSRQDVPCKLRLGGVVHAARGLWACDLSYSVAAICPSYMVEQARAYLAAHGCIELIWLGEVSGAPNVMVIGDPTEVSAQGYEDLLRSEKSVTIRDVGGSLSIYEDILVFPGIYDLSAVHACFSETASVSFDIAYGTDDFSVLDEFSGRLCAIIISTSSPLFERTGSTSVNAMLESAKSLGAEVFLLKENRGGSRLFDLRTNDVENIPATLSNTVNSVGVGDVYSAVMLGHRVRGWIEAGWRGARAATVYSLTTFPDDFRRDTKRELTLSLDEMRNLGGTILPWHERQRFQIYLAAPDFSYLNTPEIEHAVEALSYHNFTVRRPVVENGELPLGSSGPTLLKTYAADIALLDVCSIVFAIPLERDPGTLIEMGMAMASKKPVVTFDPRRQNDNTMVIGGSAIYSDNLDTCLNALFVALSDLLKEQQ